MKPPGPGSHPMARPPPMSTMATSQSPTRTAGASGSRPRRYGGRPSRGSPTVAHAGRLVARERRLVRKRGLEQVSIRLCRPVALRLDLRTNTRLRPPVDSGWCHPVVPSSLAVRHPMRTAIGKPPTGDAARVTDRVSTRPTSNPLRRAGSLPPSLRFTDSPSASFSTRVRRQHETVSTRVVTDASARAPRARRCVGRSAAARSSRRIHAGCPEIFRVAERRAGTASSQLRSDRLARHVRSGTAAVVMFMPGSPILPSLRRTNEEEICQEPLCLPLRPGSVLCWPSLRQDPRSL
jgi:hypothetical protein